MLQKIRVPLSLTLLALSTASAVNSEAEARDVITSFKATLRQSLPSHISNYFDAASNDANSLETYRIVEKEFVGYGEAPISQALKIMDPFTIEDDLTSWFRGWSDTIDFSFDQESTIHARLSDVTERQNVWGDDLAKIIANMRARDLGPGESIEVIEKGMEYITSIPNLESLRPSRSPEEDSLFYEVTGAYFEAWDSAELKLSPWKDNVSFLDHIFDTKSGNVYTTNFKDTTLAQGIYVQTVYNVTIPPAVKSDFLSQSGGAYWGGFTVTNKSERELSNGATQTIYTCNASAQWLKEYKVFEVIRDEYHSMKEPERDESGSRFDERLSFISSMSEIAGIAAPTVQAEEKFDASAIANTYAALQSSAGSTEGAVVDVAVSIFPNGSSSNEIVADVPNVPERHIVILLKDASGSSISMSKLSGTGYTFAPLANPEAVYDAGDLGFHKTAFEKAPSGFQVFTIFRDGNKVESFKVYVENKDYQYGQEIDILVDPTTLTGATVSTASSSIEESNNESNVSVTPAGETMNLKIYFQDNEGSSHRMGNFSGTSVSFASKDEPSEVYKTKDINFYSFDVEDIPVGNQVITLNREDGSVIYSKEIFVDGSKKKMGRYEIKVLFDASHFEQTSSTTSQSETSETNESNGADEAIDAIENTGKSVRRGLNRFL